MTWRRVAAIALGVPVLLLAAAAVFVATYDLDGLKPRIAAAIHDATGRDFAIDGPLTIAWSLTPTIAAERVRLSNIAGGSRADMATVERVDAAFSPVTLLRGSLVVRSIHLVRPNVLFEKGSNGTPNWQFAPATQPEAATKPSNRAADGSALMTVSIERLSIENGIVAWQSDGQTTPLAVNEFSASADGPTAPIRMSGSLELLSHPIRLDVETSSADALRLQGSPSPLPVQAHVSVGDATLDASGTFDGLHGWREAVGSATLRAPNYTSAVTVWRLFRSGSARASGPTQTVIIVNRAAPEPLHDITIAARRSRPEAPVDLSVSATTGADLAVAISANLTHIGETGIALGNGKLATPFADATMQGMLTVAPRPSLTGTVSFKTIDLDAALAALRPTGAPTSPSGTVAPVPATTATGSPALALGKPFDAAALRTADADIALTAARVRVGGHDLTGVDAHAVLSGGKLTVGPARATMLGGPIAATLTLDASGPAPASHLVLRAPSLDAADLTGGLLGIPVPLDGRVQFFADLAATGDIPHALAASLNGSAGLAMVDGTIDNRLVGQALGSAGNSLGVSAMLGRTGRGAVRCLALRLDARDGVANASALVADTAPVTVEGGGTIDFARELLDVHLRPLARLGGTGVSVPIDVSGGFRHPSVKVAKADPAAAQPAQIVIGALAGPRGPSEACGPALALARDGQPGPDPSAAAPAAEKPKKPADILRSLLR